MLVFDSHRFSLLIILDLSFYFFACRDIYNNAFFTLFQAAEGSSTEKFTEAGADTEVCVCACTMCKKLRRLVSSFVSLLITCHSLFLCSLPRVNSRISCETDLVFYLSDDGTLSWWPQTSKQGGDKICESILCSVWEKQNERPDVGDVLIRSGNGAPLKRGA